MEKISTKTNRYITGFNGLRSLAVIGVMFYHLIPTTMKGGYLGVLVFFVLSGYLITDHLCQEWQQTGKIDLLGFYSRRLKRLFPSLLVCIILGTAYITLFQRNLLNNLRGNVISCLAYFNNWWQINNELSYFERFTNESPFTHIWYLAVEAQNYLIWPIIFIILMKLVNNRRKIALIIFIGAILSAIWMGVLYTPHGDPTRVYYGTDTRIFSIWIGSALAFIWPSNRLRSTVPVKARRILNITGLITLIFLISSFFFIRDSWTFNYYGGMLVISLVVMIVVALTAHPGANLNCWLTNPIFQWIGKRSYGIYLYQFPVMIFYESKIKVAKHPILNTLIELVLILVISELSYHFVENPTKKLNFKKVVTTVKSWLHPPFSKEHLINFSISSTVLIIAFIGLITAPTNQVNADQKKLQDKIEANAKAAKETKKQSDKRADTTEKVDLSRFNLNKQQISRARNTELTAFGDSITLYVAEDLQAVFPKIIVDGEIARQAVVSVPLLQNLKDQGLLKDNILISLGTNGLISESDIDQIMALLGNERNVFWVNTYIPTTRWQNEVNQLIAAASTRYDNLTLIDWYSMTSEHPEWLSADEIHPNENGSAEYVSFIAQRILETI